MQRDTRLHQDIGEPAWGEVDHDRRQKAADSLAFHLKEYHPETFSLPWAPFHLRFIEIAELVIREGGWFAFAVSRGFGKSKLSEGIVEWATLHGKKHWPVLLGANADAAEDRLDNVKLQLRNNKRLLRDFPEVCHPFSRLGRSARKAEGQHISGRLTAMSLQKAEIVFPTVQRPMGWPYPCTNGTRISAFGITGSFRGQSATTEDLKTIRPDLAVADDCQTRESAKSLTQCQLRASTVKGDVGYLAGPGSKMSILMPCTVIYKGDMADTLLNREHNPEFHGERHRMMETFPDNLELWDQYAAIRRQCLRKDISTQAATDFYLERQEEMDAGAKVSWPERFDEDEVSAVQHAMNKKLDDEASFYAECQNDPMTEVATETIFATANEIVEKQHHCPRLRVPDYVEKLAAHIDVQQRILYYTVGGASMRLETAILDYGTLPDQHRTYFSYRDEVKSVQEAFPDDTQLESQIYKAIQGLIALLATTSYQREDGAVMKINQICVDAGWLDTTVCKACIDSPFSSIVMPMKGISIRAKDNPLSQRKRKAGYHLGHEWQTCPKPNMPQVQWVNHNTNYWKSQAHIGFKTAIGPGSIAMWRDDPEQHRMFADHCNAERPVRVTAKENTVDEWDLLPHKPDNHLFDNIVGVLVGLSMQGCTTETQDTQRLPGRRKTKSFKRGVGKLK